MGTGAGGQAASGGGDGCMAVVLYTVHVRTDGPSAGTVTYMTVMTINYVIKCFIVSFNCKFY